ncbi:hypothetical protein DH2020_029636 [Rehmannia glutinosa]|uniref:Uncharacterized protein n=1 Tax=Rehmannia glutinosa TaxID=99300 RepID=A0ABR0VN10_REHGL
MQVFERLDKFFTSENWRSLYPTAIATNLEFYHSDHRPVKIILGPDFVTRRAGRNKNQFRFESCWLLENDFEAVVEAGWKASPINYPLQERLRICGEYINEWADSRFRRLSKRIKDGRRKLNQLKNHRMWEYSTHQIFELEQDIERLQSQEETYWRQRSRNLWLASGDRNSKYFHTQANVRRSQNYIKGLISNHGDFCTDEAGMSEIILNYFENLFKTDHPSDSDLNRVHCDIMRASWGTIHLSFGDRLFGVVRYSRPDLGGRWVMANQSIYAWIIGFHPGGNHGRFPARRMHRG